MTEPINIIYCGNKDVFDGMLTCTLSIFKRTKTTRPFTFYLFTMDVSRIKPNYLPITGEEVAFFSRVIKGYNAENEVKLVDVTDLYAMTSFSEMPISSMFLRLLSLKAKQMYLSHSLRPVMVPSCRRTLLLESTFSGIVLPA